MSIQYNTLRVATCSECGNQWKESAEEWHKADKILAKRTVTHRCKAMMQKEIDELKGQNDDKVPDKVSASATHSVRNNPCMAVHCHDRANHCQCECTYCNNRR